jgi:hypothetical protein
VSEKALFCKEEGFFAHCPFLFDESAPSGTPSTMNPADVDEIRFPKLPEF